MLEVLRIAPSSVSTDCDALGKGMSSMMISDLSAVTEIRFVERRRMEDLLGWNCNDGCK